MEEDRILDFNQPFLSVRRFSPAAPSPKPEDMSRMSRRTLPKVPQPPTYRSEIKSGPLRNPGTVPFTWEMSPGRPKCDSPSHPQLKPPGAPKLPPGRTPIPSQHELRIEPVDVGKCIRPRDGAQADNTSAKQESLNESEETQAASGTEDGDEAYFDAPDTLSRTESFFYNCSISGVSGLDGPELRSSGRFETDVQLQDFMMGRFLPAARAVASEMPPHSHAPKKKTQPPIPREPPKPRLKKASNGNKPHPLLRYNSSFLSRYMGEISGLESEDDDDTEPESSTMKACGLVPKFLLKSSFCILDAEKDAGIQNGEKLDHKSRTRKMSKSHKRSSRNVEVSAQNLNITGYPPNFPNENNSSALPSIAREENEIQEKGCTSFRELLANEGNEWKSSSGLRGPVIERTLYIDSVRTTNSRSSDTSSVSGPPSYRGIEFDVNAVNGGLKEAVSIESFPQDIKEINVVEEKKNNVEPPAETVNSISASTKGEQAAITDSGHHKIKHMAIIAESEISGRKSFDSIESNFPELEKCVAQVTSPEKSTSTSQVAENTHTDQRSTKRSIDDGNDPRPTRSIFHIPPLPPKSPADSWLFRTLPIIPSRSSPGRFLPSPQEIERLQIATKPASAEPRREKIIKTARPSLESLPPIPEI